MSGHIGDTDLLVPGWDKPSVLRRKRQHNAVLRSCAFLNQKSRISRETSSNVLPACPIFSVVGERLLLRKAPKSAE